MDGTALPERGTYLLRGGQVVTMDPDVPDLSRGDVWTYGNEVIAVGRDLQAPGAEVIDVSGCVVLPGFVDTHWHLWTTALRGIVGPGRHRAYFPVKRRLAHLFTPIDSYRSARLALAEALSAGITTVVNWDHNLRSPQDADANLQAQWDSGLRCRLAYGNPDAFDPTRPIDTDDVERVRGWLAVHADDRLDLGLALRGPTRTDRAVLFAEWDFARGTGLPITMHVGGRRSDTARYADIMQMAADGLLGSDLQLVHAVDATAAELAAMAETGTSLSLSPVTEFKSMGLPPLGDALAAGIQVSLSIDTLAAPTNADMFAVMRLLLRMEQHRNRASSLDERRMLELATIDGARDLGLDHLIGSVTPGKRADLIAVRTERFGAPPEVDPVELLVHAAEPSDVALVIADGRVLKRDGDIAFFDAAEVAAAARESTADLLKRADWVPVEPRHEGAQVTAGRAAVAQEMQ